ncbi:MAG: hypothetical protein ACJ79O_24895, partial [Myxococcales bacterium]
TRAAHPLGRVEERGAVGLGAQTGKTVERLRNHVLGRVAAGELGRGWNVEEERLLQRQLELRVGQAADAARGERGEGRGLGGILSVRG